MNDAVDDAAHARPPRSDDIIALAEGKRKCALASGALQPIRTTTEWLAQDGLEFPVRWVDSLARKARTGNSPSIDPFAEPETDLLVAEAGDHHRILLNKFPVIDDHLLIVSRAFVEQSAPLEAADFNAILPLLRDVGGLAFYNGDRIAGASQRHRHLQWIPRGEDVALPLLRALESAAGAGHRRCAAWPYRHWIAALPRAIWASADGAHALHDCYQAGCRALALAGTNASAYNLLLTRSALLMVPRSRESVEDVSINALGFAGSFFVGARARIETIRRVTPLGVLAAVGR